MWLCDCPCVASALDAVEVASGDFDQPPTLVSQDVGLGSAGAVLMFLTTLSLFLT